MTVLILYGLAVASVVVAAMIERLGIKCWLWVACFVLCTVATGLVVPWKETGAVLGSFIGTALVGLAEASPFIWRHFRVWLAIRMSRNVHAMSRYRSRSGV